MDTGRGGEDSTVRYTDVRAGEEQFDRSEKNDFSSSGPSSVFVRTERAGKNFNGRATEWVHALAFWSSDCSTATFTTIFFLLGGEIYPLRVLFGGARSSFAGIHPTMWDHYPRPFRRLPLTMTTPTCVCMRQSSFLHGPPARGNEKQRQTKTEPLLGWWHGWGS